MPCTSCQSVYQCEFPAEINIHFPGGLRNLNKPSVVVFPSVLVCSTCGFAQFRLADQELRRLIENGSDRVGSHRAAST
jgi:hypothetical protein